MDNDTVDREEACILSVLRHGPEQVAVLRQMVGDRCNALSTLRRLERKGLVIRVPDGVRNHELTRPWGRTYRLA